MRSTERRKKVVERILIRQIHRRQLRAPLVLLSMKKIIIPNRQIKHIPRSNPGRIVIIILRPRRWHADQAAPELRRQTSLRQRNRRRSPYPITTEPCLKLLIRAQRMPKRILHQHPRCPIEPRNHSRLRAIVKRAQAIARGIPRHLPAVIPPVKSHPWSALPRLILQMRALVNLLVVINPERQPRSRSHRSSRPSNLRLEKSRRHARKDHLP